MRFRVLARYISIVVIVVVALAIFIEDNFQIGQEDKPKAVESYVKEEYSGYDGGDDSISITVSAVGDVALGQDGKYRYEDSFGDVYEHNASSYFFSNVADILSQDDLTIANLEAVLSDADKKAEKYDYGNNYWFRGKPEYAQVLKNGSIEAVNLANNHSYDFGQEGYADTRKALDEAGIQYFGYSDTLYAEIDGITVGMAGFNQLGEYEQGRNMDALKLEVGTMVKQLRDESDLVIVSFHWGNEYKYDIDPVQTELAHLAIDSGADLVIGSHPHVLQPMEKYNDRYIAYSLGNFCFGGNKRPSDFDTAIFRQTFVFDSDKSLRKIEMPQVIPCSISSASSVNDYRPMVVSGSQADRIFAKLNYAPDLSDDEMVAYAGKKDMVRLDIAAKDVVIDLKYSTSDNITGKPIYESDAAYLRKGTADKLRKANSIVMEQGYRIKVWDAYRPQKSHEILFETAKNSYYFMDPKIGSNHTRGASVDVTLVDEKGNEVDMPSGFDDMSEKAHRTYKLASSEQKKNAVILEDAMKKAGFIPLENEWWHFDDSEYKNYDFLAELPKENERQ
jgi:D-alanyl-D-alanine dipeptidase/poly-gamma-glutamate capsule biosynthesis protein CapA/YwtB (metallophosphatase superfamily)